MLTRQWFIKLTPFYGCRFARQPGKPQNKDLVPPLSLPLPKIFIKMKFEEYQLHPEVLKGIQKLGFKRPTDIQYKAIPSILKGEDVLAVAQTGTGKTAAFAIPILHRKYTFKQKQRRKDGVRCIVMVPTHELALQVCNVFQELGSHTSIKTVAIIGGVDQEPQIKSLNKGVDILVATPGRLFDLISQGHLRLHRVDTLILDEADHMLDLGFIQDIRDLTHKLPQSRQTLFFSATINQRIKKLAYSLIRQSAIRIQISPKDPVSKNVDHMVAFIEMDDKRFFLERVIKENAESKILVFVRTIVRAERVKKAMERVGIEALTMHREKTQKERNVTLKSFRTGDTKVLIATDVSARGIDIPDVEYVVNYDLPEQAENYVHRVGRTGRGKRRGQAVSFCSEAEKPLLEAVEEYVGSPIDRIVLDRADYNNTMLFSEESGGNLDAILKEIEALENRKRKREKRKK
jgi:ATP-dependent RNA helicase RhlE